MPPEDQATATGDLHKGIHEKIGPAIPEICSRTDRQAHTHTDSRHTDRQTDRNTPLPYRGGNKEKQVTE